MLLDLHPHSVIAVSVSLPTLASIALGLRFYARRRLRVPVKEDDWTVLASGMLVWGLGIANIVGKKHRLTTCGLHGLVKPQVTNKTDRRCSRSSRRAFKACGP